MLPYPHTYTHQKRGRNYGWKLWGPLGTGRRYIRWDQPHGNVSQRIIFRSPTGAHYQTGRTKNNRDQTRFYHRPSWSRCARVCVFVLKGLILVVFSQLPAYLPGLGVKEWLAQFHSDTSQTRQASGLPLGVSVSFDQRTAQWARWKRKANG